jgi:cytochrome c553
MADRFHAGREGGSIRRTARGGARLAFTFSVALLAGGAGVRAADVELGRYLGTECLTCHRVGATGAIPNIFGIPEEPFAMVLKAYRDGKLPNPVMQTIASRLKDNEIEALAAYFARTKP